MEDMVILLDQLESKLKAAKRLPGGIMSIIEQMRSALQDQAKAGEQLARDRERTIALARQEADSIVARASEEAERLTAKQTIVEAAKAESEGIRSGADEYAFEVLCQLEQELNRTLTVIANGLRTLQDKRGSTGQSQASSEDQTAPTSGGPADD